MCSGTGACGTELCVVGRCRPADAVPSPPDTRRVLLDPRDIAVLASGAPGAPGGPGARASLPDAIALGREDRGSEVVLLRFSATWRDDADVMSAFIVLAPVAGAPPPRRSATIEVARILDPWSPDTVSWGRQPRLDLPQTAAVLRARTAVPARIDVTHLVRAWPKRRDVDHGIALLVRGDDPIGAAYSMGVTDGPGPRLEVYVR